MGLSDEERRERNREYGRRWRQANPGRMAAKRRADPERYREAARRRRATNTDLYRESEQRYREANREKTREKNRRFRQKNRARRREYDRRLYQENPVQKQEQALRWRQEHPEQDHDNHRRWYLANRGPVQERLRWRFYRVDRERFQWMWDAQDGLCPVCMVPLDTVRVCVDHDHACCAGQRESCGRCVRGLLCNSCNIGLGQLGDDRDRLLRAYEYLCLTQPPPPPATGFDRAPGAGKPKWDAARLAASKMAVPPPQNQLALFEG